MSGHLWKYYLEDDVAGFRHVLETSQYATRTGAQRSNPGGSAVAAGAGVGSLGSVGTSPTLTAKLRKATAPSPAKAATSQHTLTRTDVNRRDSHGRTLLHLVASSNSDHTFEFATALLGQPLTDIYLQDFENGWTALHRALYAGNISVAHAILARDMQEAYAYRTGGTNHNAGGLIRIKDHEGNGPLDLFEMTISDNDGSRHVRRRLDDSDSDSGSSDSHDNMDEMVRGSQAQSFNNLNGDEVYTFGSNKNATLGFGDEDDRQFPERIVLQRPGHLYFRFYQEYLDKAGGHSKNPSLAAKSQSELWLNDLPSVIRNRPIYIHDVQMSKLHSAIITTDPESNLYACGYGSGGRLGTGDESARFQFVCIDGGALAHKKIASVALGQNHTLALSSDGEIFSWGSNSFGQLGYAVPRSSKEEPVQTSPRQLYGPLKREIIVGIAASRLHSVAHTSTALYTFGKNEGQLGLMDADARSLEIQDLPRRVGAALFSAPIKAVSAIDRATVCLLDDHEVWVFANYGYSRVAFPLDGFANYFLQSSISATKYDASPNRIVKVASGGDTICALSNTGEIFTISVSQPIVAPQSTTASTTNPRQIKGALSPPARIWSNKKSHLAARDADVDQNGSVILVTDAGSVWRRVKRAKIKDASAAGTGENKPKDYKFSRVSGLTRVKAVRASGYGAYAAVREDCKKTREGIAVREMSLAADIARLSPLDFSMIEETSGHKRRSQISHRLVMLALVPDQMDKEFDKFIRKEPRSGLEYDLWLRTTTSQLLIPIHAFVFTCRSKILRSGLNAFEEDGRFEFSDLIRLQSRNGRTELLFNDLDILTLIYLVINLYSEEAALYNQLPIVPGLTAPGSSTKYIARHRSAQRDLFKLANRLEMKQLAKAIDKSYGSTKIDLDMATAFRDPHFFANADVLIELSNDEIPAHSALMCQRCPFFEGMFQGRTGGQWLAERRQGRESEPVQIDLSHVDSNAFQKVLQHIYADTGEELFDFEVAEDLDTFLDHVIDVLGVANELMLERLSEVCQRVIGKYVTTRNICQLINGVAPCAITEFKHTALGYICANLEVMLQNGYLEDLDQDLCLELDQTAHQMQLDCSLVARSGYLQTELLERNPGLQNRIDQEHQAKIDSIVLLNKYTGGEKPAQASFRAGSFHEISEIASPQSKARRRSSKELHSKPEDDISSPSSRNSRDGQELMFDMEDDEDDEELSEPATPSKPRRPSPSSPDVKSKKPRKTSVTNDSVDHSSSLGREEMLSTSSHSIAEDQESRDPGKPWGSTKLSTTKLDMKAIMDQASSSRVSTLSQSLSAASKPSPRSSPSPGSFKLSQKARKRLQQGESAGEASSSSPVEPPQTSSVANPWQKPLSKSSSSLVDLDAGDSDSTSGRKPQLTMRQTVANPSNISKDKGTAALPVPRRTVSGPAQATSTPGASTTVSSQTPKRQQAPQITQVTPKQPVIQSIRHTPMPEKLSAISGLYSMDDILTEEQAVKDSIKGAVAKRSLQEIQQEQEFQEWWEKESARVMEEEEALQEKQVENKSGPAPKKKPSRPRGPRKDKGRAKDTGGRSTSSPAAGPAEPKARKK